MIYVLTHDDFDGYASAAVLVEKLRDVNGYRDHVAMLEEMQIRHVQYGQKFPADLIAPPAQEDELFILDFSYSLEVHQQIDKAWGTALTHFDHHEVDPGFKDLASSTIFIEGSNVGHMWRHLNMDQELGGRDAPWLITFAHDYDSWTHRFPESMFLNHALVNRKAGRDFLMVQNLMYNQEALIGKINEGKLFINDITARMQDLFKKPGNYAVADLPEGKTVLINSSETMHRSLIADVARTDTGIPNTIVYTIFNDGVLFNVRGGEGGFHVGDFCKKYGGGGRTHTGAYKLSPKEGLYHLAWLQGLSL